jgi:hypothetical protein
VQKLGRKIQSSVKTTSSIIVNARNELNRNTENVKYPPSTADSTCGAEISQSPWSPGYGLDDVGTVG